MRRNRALTLVELLVVISMIGILVALLLPAIQAARAAANAGSVPNLTGPVNDNADVIPEQTREQLKQTLLGYENQTSNQVVILTVSSLGKLSIEDYAHKVFNTWKLGQKGRDNGVLIVLSTGERKMRIEVGKGLEGALTDALAGQIVDNQMKPHFKAGDFGGGMTAAVDSVERAIKGEFKDRGVAIAQVAGGAANAAAPAFLVWLFGLPWWGWLIIILIAIFLLWLLAKFIDANPDFMSGGGGYYGGGGSDGGFSGGGYSGGGGSSGGGGASGGY